ncbi:MAG: hypothetical protein RR623_00975 [Bacilli bacterium]
MENYKIKVNNESESKEVQDLFFELGFGWCCGDIKKTRNTSASYIYCYKIPKDMAFGNNDESFYNHENKEITLQQLRDLVVLRRSDALDATHSDSNKYDWYVASDEKHYRMQGNIWVYQPYVDCHDLKPIEKECEVKMKEFLNPEQEYTLVKCFVGETPIPESWVEVPEGAEEYRANHRFYKNNGKLFYTPYEEWLESGLTNYKTLWKRGTASQEKLKFIEKWLNGEKIQYILGIESEKTQWHNFTEGAMQYIKRPDIKFREALKYVTIDGIEFKSVKSLLKHVKNNFDLEDGE